MASTSETISIVPLADPALEEPEVREPEVQEPEVQEPEVREPKPKRVRAKAPKEPTRRVRAPRPSRAKQMPVEVIEPEDEPPEPQLGNDYILQHLLNHRVRQRVQREELYKSFVSQF